MNPEIRTSDLAFPDFPIGYVWMTQYGYIIRTDQGYGIAKGQSLRKEDFPALYAVLSDLPKLSRWQRFKNWITKTEVLPRCAYGETEEEFNLPDMRARLKEHEG